MLITLIRPQPSTGAELTIGGVSGQRAAGLISAMATDGRQVPSTHDGPVLTGVEGLQFALLHVSTPPTRPVARERDASDASLSPRGRR
jgi:hypothetical protein